MEIHLLLIIFCSPMASWTFCLALAVFYSRSMITELAVLNITDLGEGKLEHFVSGAQLPALVSGSHSRKDFKKCRICFWRDIFSASIFGTRIIEKHIPLKLLTLGARARDTWELWCESCSHFRQPCKCPCGMVFCGVPFSLSLHFACSSGSGGAANKMNGKRKAAVFAVLCGCAVAGECGIQ